VRAGQFFWPAFCELRAGPVGTSPSSGRAWEEVPHDPPSLGASIERHETDRPPCARPPGCLRRSTQCRCYLYRERWVRRGSFVRDGCCRWVLHASVHDTGFDHRMPGRIDLRCHHRHRDLVREDLQGRWRRVPARSVVQRNHREQHQGVQTEVRTRRSWPPHDSQLSAAKRLQAWSITEEDNVYSTIIALFSFAIAVTACGGASSAPTCTGTGCTCTDSACTCAAGTDCKTECGADACSLNCTQAAKCNGNSDDALSVTCNDSSACKGIGGDASHATCLATSNCDFKLGAQSVATCSAGAVCKLELGTASTVTCADQSSCNIKCDEGCRATCAGTAVCAVTCGAAASAATVCAAGVYACGPC